MRGSINRSIVVNPRTKDITYDPQGVVNLAKEKNTAEATLNGKLRRSPAMRQHN